MTDEGPTVAPDADSMVPGRVETSGPLDLERAWRELVTDDRNEWASTDSDEQFWSDHAEQYEQRFPEEPAGMDAISELVAADDTVLEIGPGTGRYTRRIAEIASGVTVVEDAAPAREQLRSTLDGAGHSEAVTIVPSSWEDIEIGAAGIDEHDVVLAGWSLYRQPDIGRCLDDLLRAARRGFVIVDSAGAVPPHRRLAIEAGEDAILAPPPRQAYYAGLLADRGIYPEVRIERTPRVRRAGSRDTLLETLLGDAVSTPSRYAGALEPWIDHENGEWRYRYEVTAAVLVWSQDWHAGRPTEWPAGTEE